MNTQRFVVVTDTYAKGWEYGTIERARDVAHIIGPSATVVVEERQRDAKGLWGWVRVDGPRKPQEAPPADLAPTIPDDPAPAAQPQKKRAGVRSAKGGRSKIVSKRRRVAK